MPLGTEGRGRGTGSSLGSPGRSLALFVDLFILLPLKAGGEEEGMTRTTWPERKKKKAS